MDVEAARLNMVERQIRPWGVLDEKILKLLMTCPREKFVPEGYQQFAFADIQIPLGHDEVMLQPKVIGRILSALKLTGKQNVLEIGTGSGYLTALLAKLSRSVTSIEINSSLALQASKRLSGLGIFNAEVIHGNVLYTLKGGKAFDVVVITGSLIDLPIGITHKTKYGGSLFAIVGHEPAMQACIFTRINEEEWSKSILFETVIPPLKEIQNVTTFEF
jgi:protein-L-isoaspartate(D-aspartate) O-methyltransferase